MARIRTIKPEFCESESVGKLSRNARLLFILLWTFVDDSGKSRASSRLLASRLYPYDDDAMEEIGGWLEELELGGHIRLYEVDGAQYLDIPKWLNHQKIDHPSKSRIPDFREDSRALASDPETFAPHTLDLGPVPRTKDLGPSERASAPTTTPTPQPRGTRIPDDWTLTDDDRAFARDLGLDSEATAAAFADYWRAKPGAGGRKADWSATWRNWCRRESGDRPAGVAPVRAVHPARGNDAFFEQLARIASRDPA
ncbi:MAG: hypothetical protein U1E23_09465 [Reyranellaceae bacterium]